MIDISIYGDVRKVQRNLAAFVNKQLPYGTALALTLLAKDVQEAERAQLRKRLDRPTPFTLNAIRVQAARKDTLYSRVFMQDITAAYLLPFEFGGVHKLIGKGLTWLNPKGPGWAMLNQYGNFPKNILGKLRGNKNIYVGTIRGVGGVWYRGQGSSNHWKARTLTLLIRFGDAAPVRQHIDYRARAAAVVRANFNKRMGQGLARAVATSTR